MKDYLVLGLCGVAGSGKDTFYKVLKRYMNIKRYSLADCLKEECRDHCIHEYNIDPCDCTRAEKDIIRDYLVEYGQEKRRESKQRYFINKLEEEILPLKENICITDIRYCEHNEDEAWWVKDELKGYLIYIQKYKWAKENQGFIIDPPANKEEEENNPKLLNVSVPVRQF